MNVTLEQRERRYADADAIVRFLYADPSSGHTMSEVFTRAGLTQNQYASYAIAVGDVILGFYPKSDLAKLVAERVDVSEQVAQKIALDLQSFLARIEGTPTIPEASKDIRERLELKPESMSAQSAHIERSKPLTREEVLHALSPKRTMAQDIESIKQKEE